MLASSIQSSAGSQAGNSAATNLSPAEAAADNTVAKASSTEQKKLLAISGSELFAGQLSEVLTGAEQSSAAQSHQESEQTQQQEPNAEAWLLAMLDQQQLQLQARDNAASTNAIAIAQLPVEAVESTGLQMANPDLAVEKFPGEKNASSSVINSALTKAHINPDSVVAKDVNKTFELPLKNLVNPSAAMATANAASVVDARISGGDIALANASISSAMNSSAALVTQQASTTAIPDVVDHSLVAPIALNAIGDDSVQRSTQSQLSLHAPEAKWGEQLLHALRDNVQVQIQQRIQHATIRLDPPELGSLEIYLSHEAGRLNVHITASQTDVARLIQQTSDRLRHELAGPQFTQVNVQASADGQSGQQHSRERQRMLADDFIHQNEQAFINSDQPANRTSDVLVTV